MFTVYYRWMAVFSASAALQLWSQNVMWCGDCPENDKDSNKDTCGEMAAK